MKVDVLLGLQWGDEGKGKVVDVLVMVWYWLPTSSWTRQRTWRKADTH